MAKHLSQKDKFARNKYASNKQARYKSSVIVVELFLMTPVCTKSNLGAELSVSLTIA